MSQDEKLIEQLFAVLACMDSPEKVGFLLQDLCTDMELVYMAQRLECARLLLQGMTYQQVLQRVRVSSATLSRVNRCVVYGAGGYQQLFAQYLRDSEEQDEP